MKLTDKKEIVLSLEEAEALLKGGDPDALEQLFNQGIVIVIRPIITPPNSGKGGCS